MVKITCIYRDPRDVVLSAMGHGKKIIAEGLKHTFASCQTLEGTISQVKNWLKIFKPWLNIVSENILVVKYESLIANPLLELERLAEFLGIGFDCNRLQSIYDRYNPDKLDEDQKEYLHFNRGIVGRYKQLTKKEQKQMKDAFSGFLKKYGYLK